MPIDINTKDLFLDFLEFLSDSSISILNLSNEGFDILCKTNTNESFLITQEAVKLPQILDNANIASLGCFIAKCYDEVAVDTETDGLSRFRQVVGISFAFGDNHHFYIPWKTWDGEKLTLFFNTEVVKESLISLLKDSNKKWIGHNIVFDVIAIENEFGVNIINKVFSDTSLLHHTCISEEPPHGLKLLATKYVDPSASDAQKDLEENVKAKGGSWVKSKKDFYMGDVEILGKYGALDPLYTLKLHNLWYGEIEKQGLHRLWHEEVLPLTKVVYELNSTGIKIDVEYFKQLRQQMHENIHNLELQVYSFIGDKASDYEYDKILKELKLTKRSEIGRLLIQDDLCDVEETGTLVLKSGAKERIIKWYKNKKQIDRVFSLDSKADLAFLLYDVLNLPILKTTKSGLPATDKATLDALLEEAPEDNEIINNIKLRSKEIKILNTYVDPLLLNHINGRVYPQFNQIGTSSGRFTSAEPINFQTLPRDDLRIKKGFIPDDGYVFVNADFSSLEPRAFAAMANESEIKKVYLNDLDLYSHVHKMVFNDETVSAKEDDPNFLKKVNPEARQLAKTYTLGFAYCMSEYKFASTTGLSVEEAKDIKDRYFEAFPNLKKYQNKCFYNIETKFYVQNIMGRRRRARLVELIKKLYPGTNTKDKKALSAIYPKIQNNPGYIAIADRLKKKGKPIRSERDFQYAVKNEYNNSSNFPIQSLAASIANAACIEFKQGVIENKLEARLILQVHDEITVLAKKGQEGAVSTLLKQTMEKNKAALMIDVAMKASPVIAYNLAEAK